MSRNIVLFSDGTGNSSKKLQKTNVWRLFQALDLQEPSGEHDPLQLAYYDDGVGTSSSKPIAIITGIFGFGLSRNVRELYKFLARNYQPGDRIYAFGFSRGSYTVRLLVAFIAAMGIPDYRSESDLDRQARDYWREFRRGFRTQNPASDLFVGFIRWTFRTFIHARRKLLRQGGYFEKPPKGYAITNWFTDWRKHWGILTERQQVGNPELHGAQTKDQTARKEPYTTADWHDGEWFGPEIEFVGVFDTVAAYGGPITEITRAIDDWFWPLSMPDYRLSPMVKCARHALAIDDKRGSFQPLLWDELFEKANPDYNADKPRMQQVWFSGMHADVGGGYADDSLAYVPLYWMLEHAEESFLRFAPLLRKEIEDYANPNGLMHDSRSGLASFYRYQPRYISAWIHYRNNRFGGSAVDPNNAAFRDQVIDRKRYVTQGLLEQPIKLHKHAELRLRMASGGDAPINLPRHYVVDDGVRGTSPKAAIRDAPGALNRTLGTRIRIRRAWYFATMAFLVWLLAKAIGPTYVDEDLVPMDMQSHAILAFLDTILPEFISRIISNLLADPVENVLIGLALMFTLMKGLAQQGAMRDIAGSLWMHRFDKFGDNPPQPPELPLLSRVGHWAAYKIRTQSHIQRGLGVLKWRLIPTALGLGTWLAIMLAMLCGLAELGAPVLEGSSIHGSCRSFAACLS